MTGKVNGPNTVNNLQGPVYILDSNGNGTFAGDVTLGTSIAPYPLIPQKNTVTIYSPDGKSVNLIDASGNITVISSGGGGDVGDFTSVNISPGPLNVTGQTNLIGAATTSTEVAVSVTGDTQARYAINANGTMNWGPGNGATDTNLYRGASDLLQTDSNFELSTGNLTIAAGSETIAGNIASQPSASGNTVHSINVGGSQSFDDFRQLGDGSMSWGTGSAARDTTLSRTGVGILTASGLTVTGALTSSSVQTVNAGTDTAGSAPALTPTFSNGVASQLSDKTRDYMVYLQIGTAGTAFSLAIGSTSTPANTIMASATPTADEFLSFRLPAGWYVKWAGTSTTLTTQTAIGC
jgi:hypothetical protein